MMLLNLFFAAKSENNKYAHHILSYAGIVVFLSEQNENDILKKAGGRGQKAEGSI